MSEISSPQTPNIEILTYELATIYAAELTDLANQIPGVAYQEEDILAVQKGERQMLGKWLHSLVMIDEDKPIAMAMGYERASEANQQYPQNTLYVSELAVAKDYQRRGISRGLLTNFFRHNNKIGLQLLPGELNYSIQTNSAEGNRHVVALYESFGFKERAKKQYPNRQDVVLGVAVIDLANRHPL